MIRGGEVIVWRAQVGSDQWGQPVSAWAHEVVQNVLFAPLAGVTATMDDRDMGAGDESTVTFDFPRGYDSPLAGSVIETRPKNGLRQLWDVIGDPISYMPENTPGPWTTRARAHRRTAAPPRGLLEEDPWRT